MLLNIRRYIGRALIASVGLIPLLMLPGVAVSAPANKYGVAVIIGNKDYKSSIPSVDFAHNDADAFRNFVLDVLGYDPENIIDLRDVTQAQLLSTFGNNSSPEGKLWRYLDPKGRSDVTVFYSGHGVPGLKDKRGYLLPVNADPESVEINGFSIDTLFDNLGKLETRSVTVFMDTCFSGDSQKGMLVRGTSGITVAPTLSNISSKITIVTAAQGDQVASWDLKARHGMFTRHLLDALYGEADGGEYGDGDGKMALGEVKDYLDYKMTRAARREFGRHQAAWVNGDNKLVLASKSPDQTGEWRKTATSPSTPPPTPVVAPGQQVIPPPPVVQKIAVPTFDVASLRARSNWKVEIEVKRDYITDFKGNMTISNGSFSKMFFAGDLILNFWGGLRHGEMTLNANVLDQTKRGYDDEAEVGRFHDVIVEVEGPTVSLRAVPESMESGGIEEIYLRMTHIN